MTSTSTQALDLYREWQQVCAERDKRSTAGEDWEGPEMTALSERRYALEDHASRTAPQDTTSVALLVALLWANDGPELDDEGEKRAAAMSGDAADRMKLRLMEWAENVLAPSPIVELFHRERALVKAAEEAVKAEEDMTDEDLDRRFYDEIFRLDEQIEALPAVTAADFAAKVIVATAQGGVYAAWESDPLWNEARRLTGYDG